MIIDTTISAMEDRMDKNCRLDEISASKFCKKPGWNWPAQHHAKIQYRESALRDFLIKQGKCLESSMNYIAFWQNGEIYEVQILTEPSETARDQQKQERFQEMLNKFEAFMRFGLLNNRKNQELSK